MRKIKCDNINVKILINENDFLKKEVTRLKSELWQIHSETNALHTVTMPILKDRIAWCDEENKNKINNLEKKLQKAGKKMAEKILNEIYTVLWDEKTPIANRFVNLDVKIREIAIREGVEIKED